MYDIYKPFRNRLRQVSLLESLWSVYHFMQHLDFDVPLPPSLKPPMALSDRSKMRLGLVQWEFEILARELILNADKFASKRLTTWHDIAREINSIKDLENRTWGIHSKRGEDVLYELVRIAHQQFPWQRGISQPHFLRYSRLFELCGLGRLIHEEYGMSPQEMLQLALGIAGHFLSNFSLRIPIRNELNSASAEACERFLARFSQTLDEAREAYRKVQSYDINWAYTFDPLRSRPILKVNSTTAICLIPSFLIRRATNEVYFDLVGKEPHFSKAFGPAVQQLVGEAAENANRRGRLNILSEASYGGAKTRKDTADWLIADETATLLVECKSARARLKGTTDLTDHAHIDKEFERIRAFAVQIYKTLADALGGKYPQWKPDGRPVYPLLVTLEDWQTFGLHVDRLVVQPLREELRSLGIDPALIENHPLSFCALDTFEQAVIVFEQAGIDNVFRRKTQGEYPQWALETFLLDQFSEELAEGRSSLFSGQWAKLRPPSVPRAMPRGKQRIH
ncbi:MAG: hypothetical protein JO013_11330 [Alphaproteobacteria bacterium]|nr:hypothetical protein [Alphaproteobacteria bacterium]